VSVHAIDSAKTATLRVAVDRFLSSPRCKNPNTRRAYTNVLDRVAERVGADRVLAGVSGDRLAEVLDELWGQAMPATWNRNRASVAALLIWCAKNSIAAPALPASAERRREDVDETKALTRAEIERLLTRRDVPLREKTLWRMLYETAARANEILALDIEDLDVDARRAAVVSKGGATEYVYWASGTARLLPRLIAARAEGPLFLSERRPGPARRPASKDLCPTTGRARLGYDRARVLLDQYTSPSDGVPGWDLHQLRHSAATHLGEQNVELGLLMAKTRHRNPRTAMRYVKPGADAVAEVTALLDVAPPRRG
jgi:integrase